MFDQIKKSFLNLCLVSICLVPADAFAQMDSLRTRIEHIIPDAKGSVGVSLVVLETGDTMVINGYARFPMQSVYKFPLALAVMHQVDKGKLSLGQIIHIEKEELLPDTWSPLKEKYPDDSVDIALSELLDYTVSESDNNGCDILFRLLGGPNAVDQYVHSVNIRDMAIAATEAEMHKDGNVQYTNWSTPVAMTRLFRMFYNDGILTPGSKEYLWKDLVKSTVGAKRIKALLPPGTVVAHKSGSSGENSLGITAAANDAGILVLPNGNHIALTVFISNSTAGTEACEKVIARIAKVVWDAYVIH